MFYVITTTGQHDYYGPEVKAYGPYDEEKANKTAEYWQERVGYEVVITKVV